MRQIFSTGSQICNRSGRRGRKFATGLVDADAVVIYNEEWAKILRSKGHEPSAEPHPNPRLSERSRAARQGAPLPDVKGTRTHKSDFKLAKSRVWHTAQEIAAYRQALKGKGGGKAAAPAASRGKGKGGKRGGRATGWLTWNGMWRYRGRDHTMRDLQDLREDCAHSHFLLRLIVITL